MQNDFAKELLDLLKKYDATVCWLFDDATDTHGIRGAGISFESGDRVLLKMDDTHFTAADLERELAGQQ